MADKNHPLSIHDHLFFWGGEDIKTNGIRTGVAHCSSERGEFVISDSLHAFPGMVCVETL